MGTRYEEVNIVKNVFIPTRDGVKLAADLFLPVTDDPLPAIFTYVPYHKDDYIGVAYKETYLEIARRGYAGLLIDIRGTGSSGGKATEMISLKEQEDGYDAVEWMAAQKWCNGEVGQWGISYGGITSLLVAAQQTPYLKAIVPTFTGVNVYLDFAYPGGRPNMLNMAGGWFGWMLVMNAMPPMYRDGEGRWLKLWTDRLKDYEPYLLAALDNPTYNEVWKQGSPELVYDKINIPTMLIGGWRDIFPEAMVRCYEALRCPKKLIMGPWMHEFPNRSLLPRIDVFKEVMRWFDQHLRGEETGIMDEPPVSIYVQGLEEWRYEEDWPIPGTQVTQFQVGSGDTLVENDASVDSDSKSVSHNPTVGSSAGLWNPFGFNIGLPMDQREDEAGSISFTSPPVNQDVEIAGSPSLTLHISTDIPDATLVAKLCDVAPDGSSSLITSSWLALTHRNSHEDPEPINPDEVYKVEMTLWATSYQVKAGHLLRLNVATADFPRIWPSRHNGRHTIHFGGDHPSSLSIPVRPPRGHSPSIPPYEEIPRAPLPPEMTLLRPYWKIERDILNCQVTVLTGADREMQLEGGARLFTGHRYHASARRDDPSASLVKAEVETLIEFPDMDIAMEGAVNVTTHSAIISLNITVDGHPFYQRTWTRQGWLD